jgi:hypothetical protein
MLTPRRSSSTFGWNLSWGPGFRRPNLAALEVAFTRATYLRLS